ncbi:hypothetical protein GCAAIG_06715 [Candidatus Electronema halotolerans]
MLSYSLGGLPVQISAGSYCNLKEEGKEYDSFLDQNHSGKYIQAKIQIDFKLSRQYDAEKAAKNKIYSQHQINLYAAANGGLELQYLKDGKADILWHLAVDSEFSIFEFFLSPHDEKKNDCYRLAFNRFFLQHTFINHHGLIIHAAGGSIHGKGMVFPAVSGTGKSTLSHLLLPFPENQLYSEERIIMRRMNDGWQLWGTPWKGTGVIARNESAPLSALVFLSQASQTKISELAPSAALRRLLETVSIPWYSQEWTDKGLAVCESLLLDIPAFELAFRPDQTAVQAVADLAALLP